MYKIFVLSALLIISLITQIPAQTRADKGYEIMGTTIGFPDSTLIRLLDPGTGTAINIDSAFIINNKFHFTGSLNGEAKSVILSIARYFKDYKYFWLENSKITFTAEKGKFRDAIISGSKAQAEQDHLDAVIDTTNNDNQQRMLFIRSHPNSIVSAYILSYGKNWGRDTIETLYNGLSDKIKKTTYGKYFKNFLDLNKKISVGGRFVDFSEQNAEGKNISLSDFRGKVVLLEFWASNCSPCRTSNPGLVSYYNEFKDRGFDVLGVSMDSNKGYWLDAIKEDHLPWKNISDLKGWQNKAGLIYGITYIPANFLIDRNGTIIAKDLRDDALRNKLAEVLK